MNHYKMNKPWLNEPDKVEFEEYGLPCLIVRNANLGNLCGYVGVEKGHPLFGQESTYVENPTPIEAMLMDLDVHGGITYANECHGKICHTPKHGKSDHVWWLGFDCGHAGDFIPKFAERGVKLYFAEDVYRDIPYVKAECRSLAKQLVDHAYEAINVLEKA